MSELAFWLWIWYHAMTELFDRALPGYWLSHREHTWVPFDMRPSMAYARECHDIIEEFRDGFGIDDEAWIRAKRQALRELPA